MFNVVLAVLVQLKCKLKGREYDLTGQINVKRLVLSHGEDK